MQIKEASVRYSQEIAELREFFAQAGLGLDSEESLHRMTMRLRVDRTFRRDLTSHLWVILHAGERQARPSDALAMLAIAAAGPHFAADAGDAEAHELLRFVLQTSNAFDQAPAIRTHTGAEIPYAGIPATLPTVSAQQIAPTSFSRRVANDDEPALSLAMPEENNDQRRLIGIGAAACALLVVLLTLVFHHHSAVSPATPAASNAAPVAETTAPQVSTNQTTAPVVRQRSEAKSPIARRNPRATPYSRLTESANELPPAASTTHAKPAPGTPMGSTPRALASNRSHPSLSARSMPAARTMRPAPDASSRVPNVVPVETLGLRGNTVSAGTTRQAIVRPTSLGIMAANVTYSPVPAYPAAASAARVQGEVKLEAEVGRDGTVASTRIISGPPLLADAAANAVQQWRYRPYLYAGKPIAMNAQIVMDFQLP